METDKYALALERAVANGFEADDSVLFTPFFNACKVGLDHGMQLYVPIADSEDLKAFVGSASNAKVGDTYTHEKETRLGFKHLVVNEAGEYLVPVYPSVDEATPLRRPGHLCPGSVGILLLQREEDVK